MAWELARRGIRVVLLESGRRHDFSQRFEYMRRFLDGENPWRTPTAHAALDRYTTSGSTPYPLEFHRVRGVGGSTLIWEGYTLRCHANDLRLRSLYGIAEDWPISYEDLEPYYARAEAGLGVAGAADDPWASPRSTDFPLPPFPLSYSDGILARACNSIGITLHHLPQARNSIASGGRSQCQACGTCHVCPTGAKASVDLTHIPQAEATGNALVLPEVTAQRLELDRGREVRSVVYAGWDRQERRLSARLFVLAAGAVENVRILSLSASADFPNGLANGSGLLGKHFMSHPSIDVIGRVKQPVYPFRTGFSTAMTRQFSVERDRAREGAFTLEFSNSAGLRPAEIALSSGRWGSALKEHVAQEFGHTLGIRIFAEQLPDPQNAVTLNPRVKDYFGNPVPHIAFSVGPYERASLEAAMGIAGKILRAAGAEKIQATSLHFAAHQIGTHRMGRDQRSSVVDADLRAHDVPNLYLVGSGCFVTGTSSPPTLTIAALAIRTADHIAARLRSG